MDSLTATLQTRLQTTNASTHQCTLQIQQEAELLPSLTDYPARFRHVIYVRLTRHEKLQLEREVFRYGYRGFSGEREVAEELARNPTVENEGVALAVFWGWEWAGAVLRGVVGCFEREGDGDGEVDDVVEWLMERLSIRDDEILPESVRRRRVEELVGDGVNGEFFAAFGDRGGRDEMRRMHPRGYVVAPHPDDLVVWRLLAYQVEKNSRVLRMWPGLHEGAAIAGGWGVEYPYFEVWEEGEEGDSGGEDKSIGEPEVNELGLDIASLDLGSQWGSKDITEERNQDDEAKVTYAATDTSTGSGGSVSYDDDDLNLTISTTSSVRRRNKQRDDLCALFEASDVWDVWTFCQMLRCEEAIWGVDQCPGTEQGFYLLEKLPAFRETWIKREVGPRYSKCGFLQRRVGSEDAAVPGASESPVTEPISAVAEPTLAEEYLTLKHRWPIPLPREFIEFAEYGEYRFENIDDEDTISFLLTSAGLSNFAGGSDNNLNTKWDLIHLNWSRRDPLREDSGREHLHHTLYTSDDYIQIEYDKG